MSASEDRIPESVLTETWYDFMHALLAEMQKTYRRLKDEQGLDQQDIAARIGRDPETISLCLSGQQNMTVRTMHNIARGMNCRLKVSVENLADAPKIYKVAPGQWWQNSDGIKRCV